MVRDSVIEAGPLDGLGIRPRNGKRLFGGFMDNPFIPTDAAECAALIYNHPDTMMLGSARRPVWRLHASHDKKPFK
jgi:hypothetical protein